MVSQLGDWFNAVAVYDLVLSLTGSATAVATMMVVQALPMALVGPLAGVVVDRFDRRKILIAADLLRGVLMLGLVLVRRPDQVWLAYVITTLSVSATGFFEPARTAMIPVLVPREDLLTANSLSSATWSAMLATGAALGGFTAAILGRDAAFVVNSLSFFGSAAALAGVTYRSAHGHGQHRTGTPGFRDFVDGWNYVRANRRVAAYLSVKGCWAIAGGILLLYTVYGQRVFPIAGTAAAGIGVLYAARGIGAGLGAVLAKSALGSEPAALRRQLGPSYLAIGACYCLMAVTPTLWVTAIVVVVAHGFGSLMWVASTSLLQLETDDRFRGRVFAIELALMTIMTSAASYLTAFGLDHLHLSPRVLSFAIGTLYCVPGLTWLSLTARKRPVRVDGSAE